MNAPRSTLALAPLLALLLPACDAGTKASAAGSPGPQLVFVQPRMDHDYAYDADKKEPKEKVEVFLDLKEYTVGKPTKGADGKYQADSGQHVHLILDNGPYEAIYDTSKAFDLKDWKTLAAGTHVLRAFPSAGPADSKGARWHESRKNEGAFAWVRFNIDKKGGDLADFDGTKPLLTYSRPKGEYKIQGPDKALEFPLLLDFYVSNVALSKGGFHVRATMDSETIDCTEWKPYAFAATPAAGDHKVTLELLDATGKPVEGPFNKAERTIKATEK